MDSNQIIIKSDLKNLLNEPPDDEYENNLLQELEELLDLSDFEDESESEAQPDFLEDEDEETYGNTVCDEVQIANFDREYLAYDDVNAESQSDSPNKKELCLTEEEQGIIENCADPQLKQLLLLNRTKAMHIKEMCRKLYVLYDELYKNVKREKEKACSLFEARKDREMQSLAKSFTWRVGIPYFKDTSFYPAPPNKDFFRKKENKEFYMPKAIEGRKWTLEDQRILQDAVTESYFKYRESQLEQNIRMLRSSTKNVFNETEKAEIIIELDNLEKELDNLRTELQFEPPPLKSDEGIDWLKIAAYDLKGKHTYLECKAFWNIYKHPSINKSDWQPEENERIKELVKKYSYDWDVIAKELDTNRSGYLVCIHYNTKLCDKFKRTRFHPEEDKSLLEVIDKCRLGDYIPWARVAYHFENRSRHQLYHRYRYYLSYKTGIRKGAFCEAEDILLIHLVERFGKNFSKVGEFVPYRTAIQLRNRYSNYLDKSSLNMGSFSIEEDKKIVDHVKLYGEKNWGHLGRMLKRTRTHARQRYLTITKMLAKDPTLTIETLPRRKQPLLVRNTRSPRMNACLEKLQELEGIPTLRTVENILQEFDYKLDKTNKWKFLRAPRKPPRIKPQSRVDQQLKEFFKGTCKLQGKTKIIEQREAMESARRVIKLFDVLGADVNSLKTAEVGDDCFISDRDEEILKHIKQVLQNGNVKLDSGRKKNSFLQIDASNSNLAVDVPQSSVKHLLPPCVNTIMGLRGMIIRYQVYKNTTKDLPCLAKPMASTAGPSDPVVWGMEQNLTHYDESTRAKVLQERKMFFTRLYAAFKWPSLISRGFPQHLLIEPESDEESREVVVEEQSEKRRSGRPTKKVYVKVLKMVEARKRKYGNSNADQAASGNVNGPVDNDANKSDDNVDDTDEPKGKKTKKGEPSSRGLTKHAIAYIPRRSHVKTNRYPMKGEAAMDVDDPAEVSNEAVVEENQNGIEQIVEMLVEKDRNVETVAPNDLISVNNKPNNNPKVINISDLKLLNPNAVVIGKDKIDDLIKLNQAPNAKKIIILPNAKQIGVNSSGIEKSHNIPQDVSRNQTDSATQLQQNVMVTNSKPKRISNRKKYAEVQPTRASKRIATRVSCAKSVQDETPQSNGGIPKILEQVAQKSNFRHDQNKSAELFYPGKLWDKNGADWETSGLSTEEFIILEEDSIKVEQEETPEKLEMCSADEYDEFMDWDESDEEMNENDELSKEYMEEFVKGIDDDVSDDESLRAKFQKITRNDNKASYLNKTIERMKAKLKQQLDNVN